MVTNPRTLILAGVAMLAGCGAETASSAAGQPASVPATPPAPAKQPVAAAAAATWIVYTLPG